jgi:hypothetical protein
MQRHRTWDDVRQEPRPDLEAINLSQFVIRADGRELEDLIEVRRDAGRFEVVEDERQAAASR